MNQFDKAQEIEMLQREVSIAAARKLVVHPQYTGKCHYCRVSLPALMPRRFCDSLCRDGWEEEQKAMERAKLLPCYEDPMNDWSLSE